MPFLAEKNSDKTLILNLSRKLLFSLKSRVLISIKGLQRCSPELGIPILSLIVKQSDIVKGIEKKTIKFLLSRQNIQAYEQRSQPGDIRYQ